jgi:hypothetical protein
VGPEKVTVRFLHPLAEADLEFRVKVLAAEPPLRLASPPPMPAQAVGIDSAAIEIVDSAAIPLYGEELAT